MISLLPRLAELPGAHYQVPFLHLSFDMLWCRLSEGVKELFSTKSDDDWTGMCFSVVSCTSTKIHAAIISKLTAASKMASSKTPNWPARQRGNPSLGSVSSPASPSASSSQAVTPATQALVASQSAGSALQTMHQMTQYRLASNGKYRNPITPGRANLIKPEKIPLLTSKGREILSDMGLDAADVSACDVQHLSNLSVQLLANHLKV